MTSHATILPAVDPRPLADRYEQAARAVEAYVAARRKLSVAVLGTGSPARMLDMLEICRANAAQMVRDIGDDFRMPFPTIARLLAWSNRMRDCETTAEGDEDEADHLRALAAACTRRDTQPCATVRP